MSYSVHRGRHLLNTPGPTNVPERVLQAMVRNPMDLSDPVPLAVIESCFQDIKKIFKTEHEIFMYAANGHGAWEAALVNTMSPGDLLLVPEMGNFSTGWGEMAEALQMRTETIKGDWRQAIDPAQIRDRLAADKAHEIKGLLIVQTDTATSVTCDIPAIRKAIDEAGHPALLLVDTIPTLAVSDFRMDEWGVDVAVSASQKGLMMPPGLGFVAASPKALEAHKKATSQRRYWDWSLRLASESYRTFCGTSPQSQLYGLRAALDMLLEEGLENVFARHKRLAAATHRCVEHWGKAGSMELNAIRAGQRADGVTTKVSTVAKARPNTMADDSCVHHWVEGAPTETSRVTRSILTPSTMGMRPRMVVMVVSSTGRRRCAPVRMIASMGSETAFRI